MKKVLLLTFGFVLSLTMSAQLCPYILGFQLNSGKGGCPATAPCVTADPTSPLYIVEARLSILFTSSFTLPASPIVITSIQVIGETSPRPFIFCENVAARATVANRTTSEFCIYSTGVDQPFNIGDGKALRVTFDGGETCIIEKFTGQGQRSPLPVSFKNFTASRKAQNVVLNWETAMEQNNKGFHIQRNTKGTWENIAFVFSAAQDGNSSADLSYSFNDLNNERGVSQYRILQMDFDGRAKASDIRSVRGESMAAKLWVYPNPSMGGKLTVVFEEGSTTRNVVVNDMSGRMIRQYKNISSNNISIEGLETGVYSIQVIDLSNAAISVEKFIIKKR